jgi:hypothetical protein
MDRMWAQGKGHIKSLGPVSFKNKGFGPVAQSNQSIPSKRSVPSAEKSDGTTPPRIGAPTNPKHHSTYIIHPSTASPPPPPAPPPAKP